VARRACVGSFSRVPRDPFIRSRLWLIVNRGERPRRVRVAVEQLPHSGPAVRQKIQCCQERIVGVPRQAIDAVFETLNVDPGRGFVRIAETDGTQARQTLPGIEPNVEPIVDPIKGNRTRYAAVYRHGSTVAQQPHGLDCVAATGSLLIGAYRQFALGPSPVPIGVPHQIPARFGPCSVRQSVLRCR